MKEKRMKLKSQIMVEEFISSLIKKYPGIVVKDEGTLGNYKGSSHFHLSSGQKGVTGVVELTFLPNKLAQDVIVKLAKNRESEWSRKIYAELVSLIRNFR